MILAMIFFGGNYVLVRGVVGEFPPVLLSFLRFGGAFVVLLPFLIRQLAAERGPKVGDWRTLCACGFLLPVVGSLLSYVALTETVAFNAALLQITMPIFIAVIAWIALGDKVASSQGLAMLVAIGGVCVIITKGDAGALLQLSFNPGDLLLVASNVGFALYAVQLKRKPVSGHPLTVLAIICGLGAAFHLPLVVLEILSGASVVIDTKAVLIIAYVAIFPSVLAILFFNVAIARLGPTIAACFTFLLPVVTAILGWVFLDESIRTFHYVGSALIVAGVYVVSREQSRIANGAPQVDAPAPRPT